MYSRLPISEREPIVTKRETAVLQVRFEEESAVTMEGSLLSGGFGEFVAERTWDAPVNLVLGRPVAYQIERHTDRRLIVIWFPNYQG